MARETRTPEEIEEHYKQKKDRRHRDYVQRIKIRNRKLRRVKRDAIVRARNIRRHEQVVERNIRRHKARIKRRKINGRYDWNKLSPERKAALLALNPWDL